MLLQGCLTFCTEWLTHFVCATPLLMQLQASAGNPSEVWWKVVVRTFYDALRQYGCRRNNAGILKTVRDKGKDVMQQLQSQLHQQEQQYLQGTVVLPAEQRRQLAAAVAAISEGLQELTGVADYLVDLMQQKRYQWDWD